MRARFSVVGLLMVVTILGVLAKNQFSSMPAKPSSADSTVSPRAPEPGATLQQQSDQIQQPFRQTLESTLQQARPMPDDK